MRITALLLAAAKRARRPPHPSAAKRMAVSHAAGANKHTPAVVLQAHSEEVRDVYGSAKSGIDARKRQETGPRIPIISATARGSIPPDRESEELMSGNAEASSSRAPAKESSHHRARSRRARRLAKAKARRTLKKSSAASEQASPAFGNGAEGKANKHLAATSGQRRTTTPRPGLSASAKRQAKAQPKERRVPEMESVPAIDEAAIRQLAEEVLGQGSTSSSQGPDEESSAEVVAAAEPELEVVDAAEEVAERAPEEEVAHLPKDRPPHLVGPAEGYVAPVDDDEHGNIEAGREVLRQGQIRARDVIVTEVKPNREMKIARLRGQLERVLFSPGVHFLQDPRTFTFNFDPTLLHQIPLRHEFAYHRCPQYITPGRDPELIGLAKEHDCKFVGSTSTLTKALSQIYFAISGNRGVDLSTLSQAFSDGRTDFTFGARLAASLIVTRSDDGLVFVDGDKSLDTENVLSDYGRILEKLLTSEPEDFKRFLTSAPESAVPEEERTSREAYRYQKAGQMLMRSQSDAYHPDLPGTGIFDIKTRACMPVRMDRGNWIANSAYDIDRLHGFTQSYEREYYDLVRAAMLKFSLQARIGMMDGIFVAYHSTRRMFGFQYIPLTELDERLFGSTELAEQAFKLSVSLLQTMLAEVLELFPEQRRLSVVISTKKNGNVQAYVSPADAEETKAEKPMRAISLQTTSFVNGNRVDAKEPVNFSSDRWYTGENEWDVEWKTVRDETTSQGIAAARRDYTRIMSEIWQISSLAVPEGYTVEQARAAERKRREKEGVSASVPLTRWRNPGPAAMAVRREAKESGRAYEERKRAYEERQQAKESKEVSA